MHRYLVPSLAELDDEFGRWLCEAATSATAPTSARDDPMTR